MRELYNEYFRIPKNGRISEKVMVMRVAITILIMIICLAAVSITAYAYFSHDVTSNFNIIKAADYDLTASVSVKNNSTSDTVEPEDNGTYLLTGGTYTVTLTKAGTAKTGFCIVEATVGNKKIDYHTQQIGKDGEITRNTLSFTLDLTELTETAVVKLTPHWGTSSYYGYENLDSNARYIRDEGDVKITDDYVESLGNAGAKKQTAADDTVEEILYTVVDGDTLTKIANRYNTTVALLSEHNGIADPSMIYIGQQLKIPQISADTSGSSDTEDAENTNASTTES